MPRPTTKDQLLAAAASRFDALTALIDSMTDDERDAAFDFAPDHRRTEAHWSRDKNLRDVLVHLHEWHLLLLEWVATNERGVARPFLPEPYTWKTYGQMNEEIWARHQATPLPHARELLDSSHARVTEMIERFTDAELFEKQHFAWTGTTTLGSYCVSATSSHYDWAAKKLRVHLSSRAPSRATRRASAVPTAP
ncbi:ClbS/DfsB family four-helix bundle protein [Cellulomonas fimi]|uniref:DinB-like domain-containing protein n=1 Tax=Cellulomonas fimi (strain ATCC 484 / DSM 20113 / JCM 1341 / CCUG 24087 / LMG 16345 / NBRC 15513 / NCIMB 8980 / NCTC 7547 / NRS-133) TaxID=590998 RepID=F4GZV1_CELFA|nr:ClbS/DfsB family four-helix bundle protein [Cellulomonas fimi]AEE47267.1 protein of unknown function DUF1706 [Cellulomonas fimi ATCC 484]NNH06981.1 ClbS/DfsB family four-helix bundle protein [Cellulomonas fimi]VEH35765.1 Uncharacterized conserved protein [Cellulomonas fimi]